MQCLIDASFDKTHLLMMFNIHRLWYDHTFPLCVRNMVALNMVALYFRSISLIFPFNNGMCWSKRQRRRILNVTALNLKEVTPSSFLIASPLLSLLLHCASSTSSCIIMSTFLGSCDGNDIFKQSVNSGDLKKLPLLLFEMDDDEFSSYWNVTVRHIIKIIQTRPWDV